MASTTRRFSCAIFCSTVIVNPDSRKRKQVCWAYGKKCSVKKINRDWKCTAELNIRSESINLKQLEGDAS